MDVSIIYDHEQHSVTSFLWCYGMAGHGMQLLDPLQVRGEIP